MVSLLGGACHVETPTWGLSVPDKLGLLLCTAAVLSRMQGQDRRKLLFALFCSFIVLNLFRRFWQRLICYWEWVVFCFPSAGLHKLNLRLIQWNTAHVIWCNFLILLASWVAQIRKASNSLEYIVALCFVVLVQTYCNYKSHAKGLYNSWSVSQVKEAFSKTFREADVAVTLGYWLDLWLSPTKEKSPPCVWE